jgi:hypothetical protein
MNFPPKHPCPLCKREMFRSFLKTALLYCRFCHKYQPAT